MGAAQDCCYLRGDGKTNSWTADRSSFPCCDYGEVLMKPMIGKYVFIVCLVSFPFALASSSSDPSTPAPSDRGSAIFRKSCSVCHSIHSGETKVGPSLYGVLREGSGRSEETVRQVIANGKGTMPAFKEKLDPHEIDDLLEYLRTL
jgi:mono/diheme cytochrome c family protein